MRGVYGRLHKKVEPFLRAYLPKASWLNPGRPFWSALVLTCLLGGWLYGARAIRQARRSTGWHTLFPQTMITALAKARDSVWVSSSTSLWQCATSTECIEITRPDRGFITSLTATSAGMWCSTTQGLWLWNGSWQRMPITDTITEVKEDTQGCLWSLGTRLHRYCSGSWQTIALPMRHPLAITAGDHVWIGGKDGIAGWSEQSKSWRWLQGGGPCLQDVRSLAIASDGNLWIGTGGSGVCRYNGTWHQFTPATGAIPYSVIHSMTTTRTGVWLATESPTDPSGAVTYFDGQQWRTWTHHNTGLASGHVLAIADNGQDIWFATLMGLSIWQKAD